MNFSDFFKKKIKSSISLDILKLIHDTCRESLEITAEPSEHLNPWNSKFGGIPYIPKDMPWPTAIDGRPLRFLAQINFSEIFKMDPFPEKGILQFYVIDNGIIESEFDWQKAIYEPSNECMFGVNPEDPTSQNLFRLIFFSHADESIPLKAPPDMQLSDEFPIREQYRLYFSKNIRPITPHTYEYYEYIKKLLKNSKYEKEFEHYYCQLFSINAFGHRIGGYPTFVQYDPRHQYDFHHDKNILLLQIASIGSIDWIDSGVANFLISEEKLRKLDFSDVLYNMDFS